MSTGEIIFIIIACTLCFGSLMCAIITDAKNKKPKNEIDHIKEPLFSNKERKITMEKFTRDDLSVGHVVQMRNGEYGMVFPAGSKGTLIVIFENRKWEYLSHWTTDLRSRDTFVVLTCNRPEIERRAEEKDIVAVYGHIQPTCCYGNCGDLSKDNRPVLWTRVDPKKMTVSEISEALGYPVEVVAEE